MAELYNIYNPNLYNTFLTKNVILNFFRSIVFSKFNKIIRIK